MTGTNTALKALALAAMFAPCGFHRAQAADRTWDGGGTDNYWLTVNNWDPNTAPIASDSLFFGGSTNLSPNNNFAANTSFGGITFNSGAGAFSLDGNAINLDGGITNKSANLQTINIPLTLTANRDINAASGDIMIGGVMGQGGGTFGFTKWGPGTLTLSANNTYSGDTTLVKGTLAIGNDGALGSGTLQFGVSSSSAMGIQSANSTAHTITNALGTLTGSSVVLAFGAASGGTGNLTFTNGFNLAGASATRTFTINNTTTFSGSLSGVGGTTLVKNGNGALTLSGANTWGSSSGGFTLNAGTVNINNPAALGNGANTFTITGGTVDNTSAGAITTANYPQAWNGDFTFAGTQPLNLGSGVVTLGATRQVTVNASTLTVGGIISGSGFGLIKAGSGTLTLSGANTYSGGTTLNSGTLKMGHAGALGAGALDLHGGVLDANNLTASIGALSLSGNSTIQLHLGTASTLTFASFNRTTGNLTIDSWYGTTGSAGGSTDDGIKFNDTAGLSDTILRDNIFWNNLNGVSGTFQGALLVGNQLVPAPEPATVFAGCLLLALFGWTERRRLRQLLREGTGPIAPLSNLSSGESASVCQGGCACGLRSRPAPRGSWQGRFSRSAAPDAPGGSPPNGASRFPPALQDCSDV